MMRCALTTPTQRRINIELIDQDYPAALHRHDVLAPQPITRGLLRVRRGFGEPQLSREFTHRLPPAHRVRPIRQAI
jgi:hypothetical protein